MICPVCKDAQNIVSHSARGIEYWPCPWDAAWWKPKDKRRDLVRAGALIIAAIEHFDRKAQRHG